MNRSAWPVAIVLAAVILAAGGVLAARELRPASTGTPIAAGSTPAAATSTAAAAGTAAARETKRKSQRVKIGMAHAKAQGNKRGTVGPDGTHRIGEHVFGMARTRECGMVWGPTQ